MSAHDCMQYRYTLGASVDCFLFLISTRSVDHTLQDGIVFDAIVVTRTSPEGRMMSKWLTAARKKLGGTHLFPKPEAKAQMERWVI